MFVLLPISDMQQSHHETIYFALNTANKNEQQLKSEKHKKLLML